jgi:hypothetical protein
VASFSINDPRLELLEEQATRNRAQTKIETDLIFMLVTTLLLGVYLKNLSSRFKLLKSALGKSASKGILLTWVIAT